MQKIDNDISVQQELHASHITSCPSNEGAPPSPLLWSCRRNEKHASRIENRRNEKQRPTSPHRRYGSNRLEGNPPPLLDHFVVHEVDRLRSAETLSRKDASAFALLFIQHACRNHRIVHADSFRMLNCTTIFVQHQRRTTLGRKKPPTLVRVGGFRSSCSLKTAYASA